MSDVIFKTIVTFLVIYAIIKILSKAYSVLLGDESGIKEIFLFIHVKNQEENIEYIVRTTIFNYLQSYGGRIVPYIVIVDKGSEDDTGNIAKKLCNDYEFVFYATEDEYNRFKDDIKNI